MAWKRLAKAKLISVLDASAGNEIISVWNSITMCFGFEFYSRLEKKTFRLRTSNGLWHSTFACASTSLTTTPRQQLINLVELRACNLREMREGKSVFRNICAFLERLNLWNFSLNHRVWGKFPATHATFAAETWKWISVVWARWRNYF